MREFIGIDVSKNKLDIFWLRDTKARKMKSKCLPNKDFKAVADWLLKQTDVSPDEILVTVEPTGVYHEGLIYFLADAGFKVFLANPSKAKKHAESMNILQKTDKSDARLLAIYGAAMSQYDDFTLWTPESKSARELRAMIRRLDALEKDKRREQNRLEAATISGASSRVLDSISAMIKNLESEIKRLTRDVDDHISGDPQLHKNKQLLMSIKGVGDVISRELVSLFAVKEFKTAKHFSAYLGLIPKLQESGNMKGHVRMSKAGPATIRAKIYMASVAAGTHNPDIKAQKERLLAAGKAKMQAVGAAMRKLMQICFGVIKHQTPHIKKPPKGRFFNMWRIILRRY